MNTQKQPYQIIEELVAERVQWTDAQILAEIESTTPLVDEDEWFNSASPRIEQSLYLFMAHADLTEMRHLKLAIPLLLNRAGYGDLGETMRELRNIFIRTVNRNIEELLEPCMVGVTSSRAGTRLWSLDILAMFLDRSEVHEIFTIALNDEAKLVREFAKAMLDD